MSRSCGRCGKYITPGNASGFCMPCKNLHYAERNRAWAMEIELGALPHEIAAREGMTPAAVSSATVDLRRKIPTRTVASIVEAAIRYTLFTHADIIGKSRWSKVCRVRQAICYLAVQSGNGYSHTARALDRDHSTIMTACEKAEILLERDLDFADLVEGIRSGLPAPRGYRRPKVPAQIVSIRNLKEPAATELEDVDDIELLSRAVSQYISERRAA